MSERTLLLILAAIQFTTVVDFLIIMPLGPQYMRVFRINPGQFGLIVSAYAVSAGLAGVAAGFFLDRFERKRALLWLYLGFALGTLACALAPNYGSLVAARAISGAFGGVAGSLILAIIGDVVPEKRRGAAMGLVMSSFSVASICGVPLGLVLASQLSWHIPFFVLAALSVMVLGAAAWMMPPLAEHMHLARAEHPVTRMWGVLRQLEHQTAFVFMAALTCTGFVIFPYLSNYLVANVGLTEKQLPLIYLCGGLCTIFTMNWIGRWADRAGKLRVFTAMSIGAVFPILMVTNLPRVPVALALAISTLFMICMSGRMVPAMALITGSIEARYRGGFMSVNSSVQQFASGVAAYASGHIMGQSATGQLTRFSWIGALSATLAITSIGLARRLRTKNRQPAPIPLEGL